MDREHWAELAPEVTGLWGGGRCVLIAGFNAHDTPFGQATSMVLMDVLDPGTAMPLRVPRGRRVRDIDGERLFSLHKNAVGEWLVEVFRLPVDCDAGGR